MRASCLGTSDSKSHASGWRAIKQRFHRSVMASNDSPRSESPWSAITRRSDHSNTLTKSTLVAQEDYSKLKQVKPKSSMRYRIDPLPNKIFEYVKDRGMLACDPLTTCIKFAQACSLEAVRLLDHVRAKRILSESLQGSALELGRGHG